LDPNYKPPPTTTTTKPACGNKAYKGDGNCDDENNVDTCDYDGGDCCGPDVSKKYCIKCKCKDPNYKPPKQPDCGNKDYKGDGNCDDNNNKESCEWDGGDCCTDTKKLYCTACKCLDPNYKPPVTKPADCGAPDYKGDGQCDDNNNKKSCDYDGGDCCGKDIGKTYCTECKCKDPNYKPPKQPDCGNKDYKGDGNCDDNNNKESCEWDGGDCCTDTKKLYCTACKCLDPNYKPSACGAPDYKGDGNCDDNNNIKSCDYDGGDCCGPDVGTTYCSKCECVDPNYVPPTTPPPKCGNKAWKGDGNCDDVNNNPGCEYDGGDCCEQSLGEKVKKNYCQDCKCLDPKNQCVLKKNKCGGVEHKGDGHCDDYNNNCGCDYDGGDCCAASVKGGKVLKDYCSDCGCKDPDYKKKKDGKKK